MNYSPQAIQDAIAAARQVWGLTVRYVGGQWEMQGHGGVWQPAPGPLLPALQTILDDAQAAWQAAQAANTPAPAAGASSSASWWQRFTNTPQARAVLRPVRRYVGTLAAVGVVSSVRAAGGYGEAAARDIVGGAEAVVGGAFGAGQAIGHAILDGALQPFGKSGQAIAQLSSTLGKQLTDGLGGAFKLLGNAAGAGGKLAGLGVGLAAGGIGAGIGAMAGAAIGNAPGFLIGAALGSAVGVAVMKAIESVTSAIGGVLGTLGTAFGRFGEVATAALKTVQDVIGDVVQSMLGWSREVLHASQQSGQALGVTTRAANFLQGFGVRPGSVPGLSKDPYEMSMAARAFGVEGDPNSPEFMLSFRRRHMALMQQGVGGRYRARAMSESLGYNTPEMLGFANLPDAAVARQMQRSQQMASALGMTPEQIKSAQQDMSLLIASVTQFAELAKNKLATVLMPYLTGLLDKATAWLGAHAGEVGQMIQKGVETAWDWLKKAAIFLYADFPPLVAKGLASVLREVSGFASGLSGFVKAFQQGSGGFLDTIGNLLEGLDWLSIGFRQVMKWTAPLGAIVYDLAAGMYNLSTFIANALLAAVTALPAKLLEKMGMNQWANDLRAFRLPTAPMANPFAAWHRADEMGTTDFRGAFENFRQGAGLKRVTDGLDKASAGLEGRAAALDKFAASWDSAGRRDQAEKFLGEIAANTGKPLQLTATFEHRWNEDGTIETITKNIALGINLGLSRGVMPG